MSQQLAEQSHRQRNSLDEVKTMAASVMAQQKHSVDYFLVLDFEATCDKERKISPQEIIEFPVLKINAKTMQEESHFHSYVAPTANPVLTPFCTELTGITQDMVSGKPILQTVLQDFDRWMQGEGLLGPGVSVCFVTCGDWDLKTMLPQQCKAFKLHHPHYMKKWMNIKFAFSDVMGHRLRGMPEMLAALGLNLRGRHHSGIDDSRNIARILAKLAVLGQEKGIVLGSTSEYNPKRK